MSPPSPSLPWWRQPLVHFVVLGALLFAADAALNLGEVASPEPSTAPAPSRLIVVDDTVRSDARRRLERTHGRAPTEEEMVRELDAWVRDEVLVREARALGLDVGDATVRAHLVRKMTQLLHASEVVDAPSDDVLRAYFAQNAETYRVETRITLRQIFAGENEQRARAYASALNAGATPDALDPPPLAPPGGPVLRGRSPERLAEHFGEGFAHGLDRDESAWQVLLSTHGWHAVRVERLQRGRPLSFEEAESRVRMRYLAERFDEAYDDTFEALVGSYEIDGWDTTRAVE